MANVLSNYLIKGFVKDASFPFRVVLPSGQKIGSYENIEIVFKTWNSLIHTMIDPEMGFCEGFMKGEIEVKGDLEEVIKFGITQRNKGTLKRVVSKILNLLYTVISNEGNDTDNVRYHYDIDESFYKDWLDESMTYSCAFFEEDKISLEEAQRKKREIIYEKLKLEPGDRLLDIGCGWGSLIIEAGGKFDIECVGITLSKNQYEFAKRKIEEKGLSSKVEVYMMHFLDLKSLNRKFNKIVSVGMFEHVGKKNLGKFFEIVHSVSEEGSLFLLHTIGKPFEGPQSRWIRKRIFPGGYIPGLNEILKYMSIYGFNLIDIDDWRLHYYKTLREWRLRFLRNKERYERLYGKDFVRMWYLYLVSAGVSFLVGSNHLFQILMSKGINNSYPVIKRTYGESLSLS